MNPFPPAIYAVVVATTDSSSSAAAAAVFYIWVFVLPFARTLQNKMSVKNERNAGRMKKMRRKKIQTKIEENERYRERDKKELKIGCDFI